MTETASIERSARRAAERELDTLSKTLLQTVTEFARANASSGGRRAVIVHDQCRVGMRQACEAAANQIAAIKGLEATAYADTLEQIADVLVRQILEMYEHQSGAKADAFASAKLAKDRVPTVENDLRQEAVGVIEDFRHGVVMGKPIGPIAGGNTTVSIAGSGAVAIGSPGAAVQTGRDNLSQTMIGWDPAPLLAAIAEVRKTVTRLNAPEEAKAEIEDNLVAIEREATDDQPNRGRLHRLVRSVAARLEQLGLGVAASVIADKLPALLAALPG